MKLSLEEAGRLYQHALEAWRRGAEDQPDDYVNQLEKAHDDAKIELDIAWMHRTA